MRVKLFSFFGASILVVVVFFMVLVVGYGETNPSTVGHSPEEVDFIFITEQTLPAVANVVRDCTSLSSNSCSATCPADDSYFKYTAVSGSCISSAGTGLQVIGVNGTSWGCRDAARQSGNLFRASVVCLKSGKVQP